MMETNWAEFSSGLGRAVTGPETLRPEVSGGLG